MVMASGVDSRLVIGGAIVLATLLYALIAFAVSWLRSSPTERKRWIYPGRHDGGGSLSPTVARWRGRHRDR
jgi:hypothetical protein